MTIMMQAFESSMELSTAPRTRLQSEDSYRWATLAVGKRRRYPTEMGRTPHDQRGLLQISYRRWAQANCPTAVIRTKLLRKGVEIHRVQ